MELKKIISETNDSTIYEVDDGTYPGPYIVKLLKAGQPDPVKVQQFYNEFEITKDLNINGVRKSYDSLFINGRHAIALQYISGKNIKELAVEGNISLEAFLKMAIRIVEILHHIHEKNIIHKDINSKNIIVQPNGEIYIIDFGISARLTLKSQQLLNPEQLEGSLAYISPEQTGRMNRAVDYRTDFYSIGITFYEMLSGTLPFQANDPIELVHSHIAKTPVPLHELNAAIPQALSDIVAKLLSKNAEDRYQSSLGIKYDLQKCLSDLSRTGFISPFDVASRDFSGRFRIPQKLYGREHDTALLLRYFDHTATGNSEMIVVSGYSGVGKTALVHEIHKPVTEKRAFFLEGKFDQFQRNTPYSCFLYAFNSFISLLLTENADKLQYWRNRIQNAIGENGKVLVEVIPRLELIIGKQPDVVQTAATESLNRFNYTFLRFLRCIADRSHPLVLFVDDLQWADSGSLSLIKQLMTDRSIGYFLFIGAYRDNETTDSHPWIVTINEIKETNQNIGRIVLKGLDLTHVNDLVADTLDATRELTKGLSEIIYNKTKGNPYFTNEFVKSLNDDHLISWDGNENQWQWNQQEIKALDVTDNVVHFLGEKILQLPKETRQMLHYASCLGSRFSTNLIGEIFHYENAHVTDQLYHALEAGYIIPYSLHGQLNPGDRTGINVTYKFAHDRVQQAIYSSISEEEKQEIHHTIGNYLLNNSDLNQEIFQVADHLNKARGRITDLVELNKLAHINYMAGKRAKLNNAHEAALIYLQASLELTHEKFWQDEFDFMFDAVLEAGEEEFINGHEDAAEKMLDLAFSKARTSLEKAAALRKKIMFYAHQGMRSEGLVTGRKALAYLGITLPKANVPKKLGIAVQLLTASIKMRNKSIPDILALPELSGEKPKAVTELVGFLFNTLYYTDSELFIFMALYMVNYSLKNGNSSISPVSYVSLGIVNAALLQNYKKADDLHNMAVSLNKKYENAIVRGRLMLNYTGGIHHWVKPVYEVFDPLYECYKVCLENGDITYAGDTVNVMFSKQLYCGKNLAALKAEFENYRSFIERINDHNQKQDFLVHHTFIENLLADREDTERITAFGDSFVRSNISQFTLGYHYVYGSQYHYIMGDYAKSLEMAKAGMKLKQGYAASILENQAVLFDALSLAATYIKDKALPKTQTLKTLGKRLKQFKKWSAGCEANFGHGTALIEAEIARINNNPAALAMYKKAIANARLHRYIEMEAIANERLGSYCMDAGMQEPAMVYLKEALTLYDRWGAKVKVGLLKSRFPGLISNLQSSTPLSLSLEDSLYHSSTSSSDILDMMTVLKASTAISSEIRIDKLLDRLINIVVENAGAQRGVFVLVNGDKFLFKSSEGEQTGELSELPEKLDDILPYSMAQYVYRTKENVVIEDALSDTRFISDPYIIKNKPKSALFIPIEAQGKVIGALYLENRMVTGAFGPNRMELLRMLSGQIAISLQNALLYENLEQKVEERTREINDQKGEIENQKKLIEQEKLKTDELLLNILPLETAEELKRFGKAKARKYDQATVMFADIIAFTKLAEQLGPEELVAEIDLCFSAFDEILETHNIEKIKTIGDAYMCASGINHDSVSSAANMIRAAIDMQKFMEAMKSGRKDTNEPVFEIRIGISTGPVVAGVVGSKKFAYDIWGDTVNMAARMEQSGEAEKVNISGSTYQLIKDNFNCTFRGIVEAKNKGGVEMYFVEQEIKEPVAVLAD